MSSQRKTTTDLSEYIDHVVASLEADYHYIHDKTNIVVEYPLHNLHIPWYLASLHSIKEDYRRTLLQLQKSVNGKDEVIDGKQ
jgi:hypothetical protein